VCIYRIWYSRVFECCAFFLYRGYFIIHQVLLQPWGCQIQKNILPKKHYATGVGNFLFDITMRPPLKPLPKGSIGMPLRKTGHCAVIHSDLFSFRQGRSPKLLMLLTTWPSPVLLLVPRCRSSCRSVLPTPCTYRVPSSISLLSSIPSSMISL